MITIFSIALRRFTVEAYHEIITSLELENFRVKHVGLVTDHWYRGDAHRAYSLYNYESYDIPRVSSITLPWWHTENINQEFVKSIASISNFLETLILQYKPNAFLIDDDTGPLEVFVIQIFNKKNIPIVLIEHGCGFAFDHEYNLILRKKLYRHIASLARKTAHKTRSFFKIKKEGDRNGKPSNYNLPEVNAFGLNGKYLICSYSKATEKILTGYGVDKNTIRSTGYPYFDKLIRLRNDGEKQSCLSDREKRGKILLFSAGHGMFWYTIGSADNVANNVAKKFYRFVINFHKLLSNEFEIILRLKPDEDLSLFLPINLLSELQNLNIKYADTTKMFYEQAYDYDLVIGEGSTLHLESIILGIPSILFKDFNANKYYKISYESVLINTLGVLTIDNEPSQIKNVVKKALSRSYIENLSNNLYQNQEFLFNGLDGKAGYRVGQVIKEAINDRR